LLALACGENLTILNPDGGLVVGSGNSTSLGRGGDDNQGHDAGLQGEIALPATCVADADCEASGVCNAGARCVFGTCVLAQALCFDGDPCTIDVCANDTGCSFEPVDDGAPCQDNNLCDGQICMGGVCTQAEPTACFEDGNPCTSESCSTATGECVRIELLPGTSCADADPCNGAEFCSGGFCRAGTPSVCNDNNPCTADLCSALGGCIPLPLADGTSCDDGNACNGTEICSGGACQPGLPVPCNDANPCTADACQPSTGACLFSALPNSNPCPDGDLCDGDTCQNGACLPGRAVACPADGDGNACTALRCDPSTGSCVPRPLPDGTSCPDDNACNGTETCSDGECSVAGTARRCADDGNPCTREACDPAWGCVHLAVADATSCADADLCDGSERCFGGQCLPGTALNCNDGNGCTLDTCIAGGGCVNLAAPDGTACTDNDLCNGPEECRSGRCVNESQPPECADDHNPCTRELCDPTWGCVHANVPNGTACPDATLCNGAEVCRDGACTPGTAVVCTPPSVCVPSTGVCP
jgi:hypothetical protein